MIIGIAAILLVGCATPQPAPLERPIVDLSPYRTIDIRCSPDELERLPPVAEIVHAPGTVIDRSGAEEVALDYFHAFFGGCGYPIYAGETEVAWVFETAVGYVGAPGPNIVVAKDRSCVFSDGGPELLAKDSEWVMDRSRFRTMAEKLGFRSTERKKG